jgi:ribosomal protein S18 acetylase RimI-like enzyme
MPDEAVNESEQAAVRRAEAADVAAIEALVTRAYEPWVERIGIRPLPMEQDYAERIAVTDAFVLEDEGEIVGLLILESGGDRFVVDNVAIEPSRQGRGLGRRLLAYAEERGRERGVPELRIYTNQKMTENIELYARLGYVEYERRTVDGRNGVFMAKRLD